MADSGHTTPTAGKDMKNVIAQFQQGKGNLRPAGGAKPKPQIGQKSSINEHADTGNDAAKLPRKLKSDNQEGTGNSTASEAANPFKVALKPVARTTSTGTGGVVAAKNFANHKSVTEGDKSVTSPKAETSEPASKVSSIANKSKMFEQQQQKQSEVVTPSSPTIGAASTKHRLSANSNALKAPVVPKPLTKPAPAADPIQKPNGTTAPSANKWKKAESKPDELKPTNQKPDTKKEFPFRKAVQDETKTGDDAAADDKAGSTNFATMRPVKTTPSTTKPSFPATGATLPKQFKPPMVASKINKATVEPEKEDEDDEQPKIPPKPSNKADQPKISAKTMEDLLQPRIPPRSTDKAEPAKTFAKTTEDIDQPKVPMRREQKKLDESTAAPKLPDSRKAEENRAKKVSDSYDQNANKVGGKSAELPPRNNMGRPLPKPAEKQYRLLPVPKQKGKAPKKKAKPPVVDLSKYAAYATPKSVVPPPLATKQLSVEAYDDGDDIYEDCDNMDVPAIKQSSRISEYSEEEEAKLEKNAKLKPPSTTTTSTDNYGKMFNAPSVDEYDDDEIYQEID